MTPRSAGQDPTWCECVEKVTEQLRKQGAELVLKFVADGGDIQAKCLVETMRSLGSNSHRKCPALVASFCPFCGAAYPAVGGASPREETV